MWWNTHIRFIRDINHLIALVIFPDPLVASDGYYGFSRDTPPLPFLPPPPKCVDDFLLPLYSKKYFQYRSQICRIASFIQKLVSYCFGLILKNKITAAGILF